MRWPSGMEPDKAPVYARNEILIPTEPAVVWRWLVRAELWPTWFESVAWIKFDSAPGPDLAAGMHFTWKIMGFTARSEVKVFEPLRELGWDAKAPGLRAYHGWELVRDGRETRVITEETQSGPLPFIARPLVRRLLTRGHQQWLESLQRVATSSEPE